MLYALMELIMELPRNVLKLVLINGANITKNLVQQK